MSVFGDIANKRMSRGDFLKSISLIAVAAFGFGNVIKLLAERGQTNDTGSLSDSRQSQHGFGSSKFGI